MADGSGATVKKAAKFFDPQEKLVVDGKVSAPDLLHPEPTVTVAAEELEKAMEFAFAGGDIRATFDELLSRASIAPSDWDSSCFATDLFVEQLVEKCMPPPIEGEHAQSDKAFVVKVLSHPPRSRQTRVHRRRVLEELLEDDKAHDALCELHRRLQRLRTLFRVSGVPMRHEHVRRRLDTLLAIRDVIESLTSGFSTCQSALRRLHSYGSNVKATEGFRRLVELLDFDDHLASVDINLRMGADGSVRNFEIVNLRENASNAYYRSPLGRLWARLSAWLKGHRFTREDLVNRWFDSVFEGVVSKLPPLLQLIGDLEIYLSALSLRNKCIEHGLPMCFAEFTEDGDGRRIDELYNPLLFTQGIRPVPCSITGRESDIAIITGPNSGGKTRLLQALGLTQMLGQSGLLVPAKQGDPSVCRLALRLA